MDCSPLSSSEKAEESEKKLPTIIGPWRKQGSYRKTYTSASLTTLEPLIVWIKKKKTEKIIKEKSLWFFGSQKNWKIIKEMELPDVLLVFWETCMWVKRKQLESKMEKRTGSKLGKEYKKSIYCHPSYLTHMQSTSCVMPGWLTEPFLKVLFFFDIRESPRLWVLVNIPILT